MWLEENKKKNKKKQALILNYTFKEKRNKQSKRHI